MALSFGNVPGALHWCLHPGDRGGSSNVSTMHSCRSKGRRELGEAFATGRLPIGPAHETVPNSHPTPAVSAMARAPQNVTRIAPMVTPAPPARAAKPPRSARNSSEVPETRGIKPAGGARAVTNRGKAAPTAKLPADANAA